MNITNKDKTTFGWTCNTHRKITVKIASQINGIKKYKYVLGDFVQKPDFDELGPMGNRHFYFGHIPKSYLDYTGHNNALSYYKKHVKQMLEASKNKDKNTLIENAGRALHFLQDMSMPLHTKRTSFIKKVWDFANHITFENFVEFRRRDYFNHKKRFNKCLDNYEPQEENFIKLFINSFSLTKKITPPTQKNSSMLWEDIGRTSFKQTMDSTREFLLLFANLKKH